VLIDLLLAGEDALVVGKGDEIEHKAVMLVDAKAGVTVLGEGPTGRLEALASRHPERVALVRARPTPAAVRKMVERTSPRVVFISTGDTRLDERLSEAARGARSRAPLVCVVDDPRLNDFNMPAIAKIGDLRIGVSTGGKSPAMAGILRRRIQRMITPQDVLQVRLQGYIRKASRGRLKDASARKALAYRVIQDEGVRDRLKRRDYAGAKMLAEEMLADASAAASRGVRPARGGAKRHG
jgi:precorrin-2 dehydrogenase